MIPNLGVQIPNLGGVIPNFAIFQIIPAPKKIRALLNLRRRFVELRYIWGKKAPFWGRGRN